MLRNLILQRYKFQRIGEKEWRIMVDNGYQVFGDTRVLEPLSEYLTRAYKVFDYTGKVVLDVGGFMGETAVLFASWGAKKIIVYEPVHYNIQWISMNAEKNSIPMDIYEEGVGESNSALTVRYDYLNTGFGLNNKGHSTITINLRNCSEIISHSKANIAKFDCEGGEKSLLSVPNESLRLISEWIIECHSPELVRLLSQKFKSAGFSIAYNPKSSSHLLCKLI
jgi:FkbM family methyltransferase